MHVIEYFINHIYIHDITQILYTKLKLNYRNVLDTIVNYKITIQIVAKHNLHFAREYGWIVYTVLYIILKSTKYYIHKHNTLNE